MMKAWPLAALCRRPWPLPSAVAPRLDSSLPLEEENTPYYHPDRFYPARLGQILNGRYQLATKLGYGSNSTVWLARDLDCWCWSQEQFVALKINATDHSSRRVPAGNELEIMKHISQANPRHQGWHFIRKLSDSFLLKGTSGDHLCLAMETLREPLWLYRERYIDGVVPADIVKVLVQMILHALDYLHSECRIIHTDLKPDNIMVRIEDPSILERDAQDEFNHPLPQKRVDDRTTYLSRNNYGPLRVPTGIIQLVDFDLSVSTKPGQIHKGAIQGEIYRAPEVVLDFGYTCSADIWSLGVMLWDLLEGKALFDPVVPRSSRSYDDQTHLGQMTALLGAPPPSLLSGGQRTAMFYDSKGNLKDPGCIPQGFTLDKSIACMSGEEKARFTTFVRRMIKWNPEERSTAKELLDDPWLYEDFQQEGE